MDAMTVFLGWLCPTEVGQLGTKQLSVPGQQSAECLTDP